MLADKLFVAVEPKEVFTVSEVARFLAVSTSTVYKLLYTGQLDYFKIGSRYKIDSVALASYLEAQKRR